MLINKNDLPSKGWKAELPESFTMIPFAGQQVRSISEAIEADSMLPLIESLYQVLPDIDANQLSIPDAYYLLLTQRLHVSDVRPLVFEWQCSLPIYQYTDGFYNELQDRPSLGVQPCQNWTPTLLDASSISILKLNHEHERFDIPRLQNFKQANSSRFDWVAAHLNKNHRAAINELEQQQDLTLFTELSDWVKLSQHGLVGAVDCQCDRCNRETRVNWNFTPKAFA